MHSAALKEIESIKIEAQKKHDEINKATKDATDKAIAKASKSVQGLDVGPNHWGNNLLNQQPNKEDWIDKEAHEECYRLIGSTS